MKKLWKKIRKAIKEWWRENVVDEDPWEAPTSQPAPESPAQSPQSPQPETGNGQPETAAETAPSPALDWRFGGFNGGKAEEDPRCRISSLKVKAGGCSLKWETGIPSDWKRSGEGFVIAAVFFRSGDKWIGGKFDWIDEKRSTRDFKNVDSGYNGWDAYAFHYAGLHAFCVVSADGRLRSNLIEA